MAKQPGDVEPEVSVAIVSICGSRHLRRCLGAVARQDYPGPIDVVVAYDPALRGIDALAVSFPSVRFAANTGQRTPLELASRAIRESRGRIVLLTEDHCVPHGDWVRRLAGELRPGRAAAGGVVELADGATATDWAFYFVDFFRYSDPVVDGDSPTLTVCNVAYRRADLQTLDDPPWAEFFHETAVNDALRQRLGALHLSPGPRVTMRRHVGLVAATRERYSFGRLFGCTRLRCETSSVRRLMFRTGAPLLPLVLMRRMIVKACRSPESRRQLVKGFLPLLAMVLAWSYGEWLGYLTGRIPENLTVAAELPAVDPSDEDQICTS
jgi:hypothetical protein